MLEVLDPHRIPQDTRLLEREAHSDLGDGVLGADVDAARRASLPGRIYSQIHLRNLPVLTAPIGQLNASNAGSMFLVFMLRLA